MAVEFLGLRHLQVNLEKIKLKANDMVEEQLVSISKEILTDSRGRAPIDTGRMVNESDIVRHKKREYHVRYNTDYSKYVHEDLSKSHPTGEAKFLQNSVLEHGDVLIDDIGRKLL